VGVGETKPQGIVPPNPVLIFPNTNPDHHIGEYWQREVPSFQKDTRSFCGCGWLRRKRACSGAAVKANFFNSSTFPANTTPSFASIRDPNSRLLRFQRSTGLLFCSNPQALIPRTVSGSLYRKSTSAISLNF
jgi:hypothetical protein